MCFEASAAQACHHERTDAYGASAILHYNIWPLECVHLGTPVLSMLFIQQLSRKTAVGRVLVSTWCVPGRVRPHGSTTWRSFVERQELMNCPYPCSVRAMLIGCTGALTLWVYDACCTISPLDCVVWLRRTLTPSNTRGRCSAQWTRCRRVDCGCNAL
jgi:hypothetical protein